MFTGILHVERARRLAKHIKRVKQMDVHPIAVLADQNIKANHVPSCLSDRDKCLTMCHRGFKLRGKGSSYVRVPVELHHIARSHGTDLKNRFKRTSACHIHYSTSESDGV